MYLKPTNKPLTAKEHDKAVCGVCGGCSASCGYIAYFKGNDLVDLYGHPHDPNGIGSFCTKGITYVQEIPKNPLRITKPFKKEGEEFKEVSYEEAKNFVSEALKGNFAFFLDRFSGIEEYLIARSLTKNVFSDSVCLPFKQSSVRPQEWSDKKVILIFEDEPTFSEVMLTRWLVDAFEKDAYILAVGSRYTTVFQKSTERILTNPYETVKILEKISEGTFNEKIKKLLEHFGKDAVVIVGDTLLKSPFKGKVLNSVKRLRKNYNVDYSFIGNITPFELKSLKEFYENFENFDTIISFGNPFIYFPDEKLKNRKKVITFSFFPTITVNYSDLVLPRKTFAEREYINVGAGFLAYSQKVLENDIKDWEIFELSPNVEEFLKNYGIEIEELKNSEGGIDLNLPDITDFEDFEEEEINSEYWLISDNTLVEELGHWNPWTHAIEREQFVYLNENTKEKLKVEEFKGIPIKVNNNIADNVIFIPNSYEEFQPFDPGKRIGNILKEPYYKVSNLIDL